MPLQFPSRDLTNQYISLSYQDVVQTYTQGNADYFLDGLGNVILFVPTSSGGQQIITIDQTIPFALTASYAMNGSAGGSGSVSSSYAVTASYAGTTGVAISSSYALESTFTDSASYALESTFTETASNVPFNGNRSITRSGYSGLNVGGQDVDTFLNNFFFPFVPATVSVSGGGTFQTGSLQNITVASTITVNQETLFGSASVFRNGLLWNTDASIPPYSFNYTDTNVSSSETYQTFVQTGNNGSPTIISSNTTTVTFLFPYLWGLSVTSGLSGTALYNAFTPQIVSQGSKTVNLVGSAVYIYFAYPASYPDLVSILDPNLFQVISSFNKSTVSVTSTGLSNNWTANYKVYQTQLVSSPSGNFQFS